MPDATSPTNIVQLVDNYLVGFIGSKIPALNPLQPEANNAVAAGVALAEKALVVYGLSKLKTSHPQLVDEINKIAAALNVTL